jgi:hypothetical protein
LTARKPSPRKNAILRKSSTARANIGSSTTVSAKLKIDANVLVLERAPQSGGQ